MWKQATLNEFSKYMYMYTLKCIELAVKIGNVNINV